MKDGFRRRAAPGFVCFHTKRVPCSLTPTPLTSCGAGLDVPKVMICPVLSPHISLLGKVLENQHFPVFFSIGALCIKQAARLAFLVSALK